MAVVGHGIGGRAAGSEPLRPVAVVDDDGEPRHQGRAPARRASSCAARPPRRPSPPPRAVGLGIGDQHGSSAGRRCAQPACRRVGPDTRSWSRPSRRVTRSPARRRAVGEHASDHAPAPADVVRQRTFLRRSAVLLRRAHRALFRRSVVEPAVARRAGQEAPEGPPQRPLPGAQLDDVERARPQWPWLGDLLDDHHERGAGVAAV